MKPQTIETMKTAEEILNKWYKPLRGISDIAFIQITEAMKEYALEVAKETQRRCAENAKVIVEKTKLPQTGYLPSKRFNIKGVVDKSSIMDPKNLAI